MRRDGLQSSRAFIGHPGRLRSQAWQALQANRRAVPWPRAQLNLQARVPGRRPRWQGHSHRAGLAQAMAAGGGFIGKSIASDEIGAAILAIRDGEVLVRYAPSGLLPSLGGECSVEQLTQRQQEVLQLIAQGKTNKEIAKALDISPFTVRIHVSSLLKALGVSSRTAAAVKYTGS